MPFDIRGRTFPWRAFCATRGLRKKPGSVIKKNLAENGEKTNMVGSKPKDDGEKK